MNPRLDAYSEYWLENETRELAMPDGSKRSLRCSRMHWGCFDALVDRFGYAPERLAALAQESSEFEGRDLDLHFPEVMAFLEEQLCRIHGVPYRLRASP